MTVDRSDGSVVPPGLTGLIDGTDLERGVGFTALVVAATEEGEPHVAMVSVGELLLTGPRTFRLALHRGSGTTDALRRGSQGLLHAVVDGGVMRLWFTCRELSSSEDAGLVAFRADVARVVQDEVAYARVRHGIEYELVEPDAVLERWRRQLAWLRGLAD